MKKYIKHIEGIIDTQIKRVIKKNVLFKVAISDIQIKISSDSHITISEDIFQYGEYLEWFGELIVKELQTNFDMTVSALDINKSNDSIYITASFKDSDTKIKIDSTIGFEFRTSSHNQRLPYSDEVQEQRESRQEQHKQYVDNYNTFLDKNSESSNNMVFPEIDYSMVINISSDQMSNKYFGDDLTSASKFIASDMYQYTMNQKNLL